MLRILGAGLVIAGCSGIGFSLVHSHKKEEQMIRWLINAIQEMEWELKYRVTPLPELCKVGGLAARGQVRDVLNVLAERLEKGNVSELSACMNALASDKSIPQRVRRCFRELGKSLGRYDFEGQIQGLETVRNQCRRELEELREGGSERLRSYQTLAICAGVALAILFF